MYKGGRKYKLCSRDYDIITKRPKLCHRKRAFRNDHQGIISGDGRVPDTKRRGPFTLGGVRLLHAFLRRIFLQSITKLFHFYGQGCLALREDFVYILHFIRIIMDCIKNINTILINKLPL